MPDPTPQALSLYARAARFLAGSRFEDEARWQATRAFAAFSEADFLREAAWVVLCSGFKEATVRRLFPYVSLCFCDWESADIICLNAEVCRSTALARFNCPRKVGAITAIASRVAGVGFPTLRRRILEAPIPALRTLPFIGPVTAYHLAKNLGLDVAKPDRHLKRLAESMGFSDTQELCQTIADASGQPVRVVDIILWRYCEQAYGRSDAQREGPPT
jgi:hypothetical protein